MKTVLAFILVVAATPFISYGAEILGGGDGGQLGTFMATVLGFIQQTLVPFILGIGFLVFVWGMFKYFIQGGDNDDAKEKGKSLIMYAVAGFVVILSFWGIVNVIANGLGFGKSIDKTDLPSVPGSSVSGGGTGGSGTAGRVTPVSGPQ